MKRSLLPVAIFFAVAAAHGDLVIEQKIESALQTGPMTMKVKGDKARVDITGGPMGAISSIVDLTSGDATTLMHGSKMVMKVSGAQTRQMMEMMKKQFGGDTSGNATPEPPKATGKKEKVGEYNAEVYTWTGNGGTHTMWITKDIPNYEKLKVQLDKLNKSPIAGIAGGMAPDMSSLPGVVVKSEMEMAGQKFAMSLVSVKEEPVDAALFEVPKDYKEMPQPTLPGAVPPAAPGAAPGAPAAPKPAPAEPKKPAPAKSK
jgi:hypothetical protein